MGTRQRSGSGVGLRLALRSGFENSPSGSALTGGQALPLLAALRRLRTGREADRTAGTAKLLLALRITPWPSPCPWRSQEVNFYGLVTRDGLGSKATW